MPERLVSGIKSLLDRAAAFARNRRDRMATLRMLDELSPGARAELLDAAGMSYREFEAIMMSPIVFDDLSARALQSLGEDPFAFRAQHGAWGRDMQRLCMFCTARSRCRRDLDADVFASRYEQYCLNTGSLNEIAVTHPGSRAPAVARPG